MFYFFFCTLSNTVNYLWSELFTSSTFILGAHCRLPFHVHEKFCENVALYVIDK